jgi:hypothetical protein
MDDESLGMFAMHSLLLYRELTCYSRLPTAPPSPYAPSAPNLSDVPPSDDQKEQMSKNETSSMLLPFAPVPTISTLDGEFRRVKERLALPELLGGRAVADVTRLQVSKRPVPLPSSASIRFARLGSWFTELGPSVSLLLLGVAATEVGHRETAQFTDQVLPWLAVSDGSTVE